MNNRSKILWGSLATSVIGTIGTLVCMAVFLGGDLGTGLAMDAMLWLIIGSVAAAFFLMQMIALLCSLRWVRRLPLKPVLLVCVAAPTFSFLAAPLFPPLMPLLSITATVLALRTWDRHTVPVERGQG